MTKTRKATKDKRLAKVVGGTIPSEIITYMRKNPRTVYSRFQNGKSIFGKRTKNLSPATLTRVKKNLKTIEKGWKSLYTPNQLTGFKYGI